MVLVVKVVNVDQKDNNVKVVLVLLVVVLVLQEALDVVMVNNGFHWLSWVDLLKLVRSLIFILSSDFQFLSKNSKLLIISWRISLRKNHYQFSQFRNKQQLDNVLVLRLMLFWVILKDILVLVGKVLRKSKVLLKELLFTLNLILYQLDVVIGVIWLVNHILSHAKSQEKVDQLDLD